MFDVLLLPEAKPFSVALILMLALVVLELVSALIGLSASNAVDSFLPDIEADYDIDIDADLDVELSAGMLEGDAPSVPNAPGLGPLSTVLGWLCIGKVPILVLLILFLLAFGLTGIAIQGLVHGLSGFTFPREFVLLPALGAGFIFTHYAGLTVARLVPKEQTEAVSQKTFVGKIAKVIRGEARQGKPAEAKVTDRHGQTHYFLLEPDSPDDCFGPSDDILIVSQKANIYRGVRNTNPALA